MAQHKLSKALYEQRVRFVDAAVLYPRFLAGLLQAPDGEIKVGFLDPSDLYYVAPTATGRLKAEATTAIQIMELLPSEIREKVHFHREVADPEDRWTRIVFDLLDDEKFSL